MGTPGWGCGVEGWHDGGREGRKVKETKIRVEDCKGRQELQNRICKDKHYGLGRDRG